MTAHDALAEGRLLEAIAIQERAVAEAPDDPVARRLLVDLLAFAGRFEQAREQLEAITSQEPEWLAARRAIRRVFRAERRRSLGLRKPEMIPEPVPKHASRRWLAIKALRRSRPVDAVRCIDAADARSPELRGFINGQEFEGLRDADDRFTSVLEAYRDGHYLWIAWEAIRTVTLAPESHLLDQLYRPASIKLKDQTQFSVHLPLVYPGSVEADEAFALGQETDHVCPDGGPMRCVGGKLLLVGDSDEVPLRVCKMVEVR